MNVKRYRLIPVMSLILAHAAMACVARGASDDHRIETITFRSNVLGESKDYCVVLPEGYRDSREDWPVLFLLHGRGRNERSLIDQPDTREALLSASFVTVLPDGDDGWYINSPVRPQDRYGDYTQEVIHDAERRFRISNDAKRRGISGWSMGGYGAVRLAQRQPHRFAAVAPILGLLDFPRSGLPAGQDYAVPADRFGNDAHQWARLNPLHAAEHLSELQVFMVTADGAFDRTMNHNFHRRLTELSIEHRFEVLEGSHSFEVVREAVPLVVEFMNATIADDGEPAE